ncbi:hypothetical protein QBC35DRAFT_83550 [Podospora australis]|uniref:Uncharacterized protein n=1 Tax=Podospora australis TaxID=1536484 RepID=A0AAN7AEN5_9PEZI|nr:hypothetical protein QBC35DRAFT_83550 [Podospora australis]
MTGSAKMPDSESSAPSVSDLNNQLDNLDVNDGVEGDAGNLDDDSAFALEESGLQTPLTAAYSDLVFSSVALTLLQDDWGAVVSSAPAALGRLGQCFVLASEPLASSLVFPENSGLPYKSLRANLVHFSDLGRKAFRDAESKMNKLSMVIQVLCASDGTIDKITRDVEDPDLAELDLPRQLEALKRVSESCVTDTREIKKTFDAWKDFATRVYGACVEEDEALKRNQTDLEAQVQDKKMAADLKASAVTGIQEQAAYYDGQIVVAKDEFAKAQKALSRRGWFSFGGRRSKKQSKLELNNAGVEIGSAGLLSGLVKIGMNANWTKRQSEAEPGSSTDDMAEGIRRDVRDPGYELANRLLPRVHRLAELLVYGSHEFNGVAWEQLAGRGESTESSTREILRRIRDDLTAAREEHSVVVRRVRSAIMPVQDVLVALTAMVKKEAFINSKIEIDVSDEAKAWREEVRGAEDKLSQVVGEYLELAKDQTQKNEQPGFLIKKSSMSRKERRYEQLRLAQVHLLEVEEKANQRRERERKEIEELEMMQQEFQNLVASGATMAQVKQIVRGCVMKLQDFCAHLDQLTTFFANIHHYVQVIDEMHVDSFIGSAGTTNKLADRFRDHAGTDESVRLRRERLVEQQLAELKVAARELKDRYRVANVMTSTYVEVSNQYIMPGVARIDRLSLLNTTPMSKEERVQKIGEIGQLTKEARNNISGLANSRRDQYAAAVAQRRAEIEEMEEKEDE